MQSNPVQPGAQSSRQRTVPSPKVRSARWAAVQLQPFHVQGAPWGHGEHGSQSGPDIGVCAQSAAHSEQSLPT